MQSQNSSLKTTGVTTLPPETYEPAHPLGWAKPAKAEPVDLRPEEAATKS